MRFYFKLSESARREEAILNGETPAPITLHRETPKILDDYIHNPDSDWWAVYKFGTSSVVPGEFKNVREAAEEFYANEGDSIYCKIHDC